MGDYIRLAYADDVGGPRTVYEPGSLRLEDSGFPITTMPETSPNQALDDLRDPQVFRDDDGGLYLFYVGRGEKAIGIAQLEL